MAALGRREGQPVFTKCVGQPRVSGTGRDQGDDTAAGLEMYSNYTVDHLQKENK